MDLLPAWAGAMHDQPRALPRAAVRSGAWSAANLIRWAFDGSPNRKLWPAGQETFPT